MGKMERENYGQPEPEQQKLDPAVLALIIRFQIGQILEECERQEFINNMNA